MAWYYRRKLDEISSKIVDSSKQLEVYVAESHVIDPQYFTFLGDHIRETNITEQLAALERTANIIEEMKYLLNLEEKRRTTAGLLNEKEKKGIVKKARTEARKQRMERRSDPYMRVRHPSGYSLRSADSSDETEHPTAGSSRQ